jgi:hypothetical protein
MIENNEQFSGGTVSGVEIAHKRKKGPIIAGICAVAAVAVVGGSVLTYNLSDYVKNKVKLATLKPDKYYSWVCEKSSDEFADEISEEYSNYLELLEKGFTSKVAVEYEASDDVKDTILESLLGSGYRRSSSEETQQIINVVDNLDTVEVGINMARKNTSLMGQIYGTLNDEKLLTVDVGMDMDDLNCFLRVPELTEKWLGIDISEMSYGLTDSDEYALAQDIFENPSAYISPSELSSFIKRYANVWNKSVEDVTLHKNQKVSVGDIQPEFTVITSEITGDKGLEIAKKMVNTAKNDDFLKNLIVNKLDVCDKSDYNDVMEWDDILDEIEDAQNDGDFDDEVCTVITFIDQRGDIRGFKITIDDEYELKLVTGADGDNIAAEFYFTDYYYTEIDAELNAVNSGDTYTGQLTIEAEDYSDDFDVEVDFKNLQIVDKEKGYVNGAVKITSSMLDGEDIVLQLSTDGSTQKISYELDIDGDDYGTISFVYGMTEGAKASLPDDDDVYMVDDYFDIEEYVDEDDVYSFIEELMTKIGLSSDYAEYIAEEISDEIYGDLDYDMYSYY